MQIRRFLFKKCSKEQKLRVWNSDFSRFRILLNLLLYLRLLWRLHHQKWYFEVFCWFQKQFLKTRFLQQKQIKNRRKILILRVQQPWNKHAGREWVERSQEKPNKAVTTLISYVQVEVYYCWWYNFSIKSYL